MICLAVRLPLHSSHSTQKILDGLMDEVVIQGFRLQLILEEICPSSQPTATVSKPMLSMHVSRH